MIEYLKSIEGALDNCDNVDLTIAIGDNGNDRFELGNIKSNCNISIYQFDNIGYLGAAFKILNNLKYSIFDFVIISNVDVYLDKQFLFNLKREKVGNTIGWICPKIWSETEHRNRNPFLYSRNSRLKINFLRLLYHYPLLHKIYTETIYKRKKYSFLRIEEDSQKQIYAGHGSIFILTKYFLQNVKETFHYPIFLYGEECYFAELCRFYHMKVVYCPTLKVTTRDHVSTSKMLAKHYYTCNYEAMTYLLKKFYK